MSEKKLHFHIQFVTLKWLLKTCRKNLKVWHAWHENQHLVGEITNLSIYMKINVAKVEANLLRSSTGDFIFVKILAEEQNFSMK